MWKRGSHLARAAVHGNHLARAVWYMETIIQVGNCGHRQCFRILTVWLWVTVELCRLCNILLYFLFCCCCHVTVKLCKLCSILLKLFLLFAFCFCCCYVTLKFRIQDPGHVHGYFDQCPISMHSKFQPHATAAWRRLVNDHTAVNDTYINLTA